MNLEDDAPIETPPEPVAETPAPVEPEAPPEPAAEVDAVEVAGRKYVPVQAVIAERKQRQELKAIADRVPQLEADNAAMRPYIEFLKANPQLMQPRQEQVTPPLPSADPDVVELTQSMDFYKPDGTPDYDRGAKHLAMMDRRSERLNAKAVQPFREASLQEKSTQNFAKALAFKDLDGRSPDPQVLSGLWQRMKLEDTADPNVVGMLSAAALGMTGLVKRRTVAPVQPPPALVTEASGGHPQARQTMSRLEETIASNRGVSATKWQEATTGFQKGRPNVLED